jgi:hypothetical protein
MISDIEKIEALITNWEAVPVEQISDGIERQMVVGQKVMICRFRFAPFVVTRRTGTLMNKDDGDAAR